MLKIIFKMVAVVAILGFLISPVLAILCLWHPNAPYQVSTQLDHSL